MKLCLIISSSVTARHSAGWFGSVMTESWSYGASVITVLSNSLHQLSFTPMTLLSSS